MSEQEVMAIFLLAGIKVIHKDKLPNMYWPDAEEYAQLKGTSPWWDVWTDLGRIRIGRRKRVISIDWSGTSIRKIVTADDVTKGEDHVHAYGVGDVVNYLRMLVSNRSSVTYTTVPIRKELYPSREEIEAKQAELDSQAEKNHN